MNYENAKKLARINWRTVLSIISAPAKIAVNGETSYICPICGHGKNGDGLTRNPQSRDGNGLKCFGCGFSGDIIDLVMKVSNSDFITALREITEIIGSAERIDFSSYKGEEDKPYKEQRTNYTEYFRSAAQVNTGEYLQGRGISLETQRMFNIGFDPCWKAPTAPECVEGKPYVIFPTSEYTYTARYAGNGDNGKYNKMHIGKNAMFFGAPQAFGGEDDIVFVTEGETDCLSVWECGSAAIALGSSANVRRFVDLALEYSAVKYIILMDGDAAGKNAAKYTNNELSKTNIIYSIANIGEAYKDPNEYLVHDRAGFKEALQLERLKISCRNNTKSSEETKGESLADFWKNVICNASNEKPIGTGFQLLDEALDGGLFKGELTVIGGAPTIGKSTFAVQISFNVASSKIPVLYYSAEMSKREFIAKSISRCTGILCETDGFPPDVFSKSTRELLQPMNKFNDYERMLVEQSTSLFFESVGDFLHIRDLNNLGDIEAIYGDIRAFIKTTGTVPLVIIDYLQIIEPKSGLSDKQHIDMCVHRLRKLCKEENLPVMAVSSFNRDSYQKPVNLASWKESGAIEYGSDILIGLEYDGTGRKDFDLERAKREVPRQMRLKVLKNRNGDIPEDILFDYFPKYNYFRDSEVSDDDFFTAMNLI